MSSQLMMMIQENPALGWAGIALILLGLEMFISSNWLMWPAISALIVSGIAVAAPDIDIPLQLLIFGIIGILSTYAGRRFVKLAAAKTDLTLNQRGARLIGQIVKVLYDSADGQSRAKIDDSEWTIRHMDRLPLEAGQMVEIVELDSNQLIVIPAGTSAN